MISKAREIIAGFRPYIGGPAWNEKAENLIVAALSAEREAAVARALIVLRRELPVGERIWEEVTTAIRRNAE